MKDTIKESDKKSKNICLSLLKTEEGELYTQNMPANLSTGIYMYCKPHTGQVVLRKGHLDRRDMIDIRDIVGHFTAQANDKEPVPDLSDLYEICQQNNVFHCRGANNKISCYQKRSDSILDCEEIRKKSENERRSSIKNIEEAKKLDEEERKEVKDIINEHFNKIDVI